MRKTIAIKITTLVCLTGFGQGTVNFVNIATNLNAPVFLSGTYLTRLSGATYRAGLFAGTDQAHMYTSMIATAPFLTGGGAGYFIGGVVVITNVPLGGVVWIRVVAWDTRAGATFFQAQASGQYPVWGASSVFSVVTGNPAGNPPTSPAALLGMNSFHIGWFDFYGFFGFTVQPTNQTVLPGGTAAFYVRAIADPLPIYQWYFNGAIIPGATNSSHQITNAQPTNAGSYSVVLRNSDQVVGYVSVSDSAILTVLPAPIITFPLLSQTALVGSTANFQVGVAGASPLAYQWFFNGSPISGTASAELSFTNLQLSESGTYTVAVTNVFGAVTSAPAMLSVIQPVPQRAVPALTLMGQPGSSLNLDNADALGSSPAWVTFDSVMLSNASQWYFDLSAPLLPQRFYRAWQPGPPSMTPALNLQMVPALTLTGAIGSKLRVDGINQFGPTDAWMTLATVTLTNTSQLYFDVSVIGQPTRLWRIVLVP